MVDRSRYTHSQRTGLTARWSRRSILAGGVAVGGVLLVPPSVQAAAKQRAATAARRDIRLHRFTGLSLRRGRGDGVQVDRRGIYLSRECGRRKVADHQGLQADWEYGSWTSPMLSSGFDVTELIPSWTAQTPGRTWVEIQIRVQDPSGLSDWFVLGRWARFDTAQAGGMDRTSVDGQENEHGTVYTDTLSAPGTVAWSRTQIRVLLMRPVGSHQSPTVSGLSVLCTRLPDEETVPVSTPGRARGRVLKVPAMSQELHVGQYPQWDNGGEAWCSPTSVSMVAQYWRHGPSRKDLAWVQPMTDPQVAYAARNTYDHTYEGCGNWPFNIAYAGGLGLDGYVTRLRGLHEAEPFILAGIPLVLSVSFAEGELDGAGYGTNGHLMVLRGFDDKGNPVMNDPASHMIPSNDEVRVTYRRDQLENAWVPHSGGTTYVIHPPKR